MPDAGSYFWLIPLLPLTASVITAFFGPKFLRQQSHWPCILGAVGACVLSFGVLFTVENGIEVSHRSYTWFQVGLPNTPGYLDVGMTFRADSLTAIMLVTVTFIGSLIAIYSAGYMRGDEGYARYFTFVALFLFSMTGLVLADNFFVLYAFWEGVGLCSYLLVGFWFTKPSAAAAARKAFLVTRLGDLGFLLGILLLWSGLHDPIDPSKGLYALDYETVFGSVSSQSEQLIAIICLLLFCGAVGKSAQFPLHVWLPDAMEGPSPVSALIHAATMVTAGVYLVARCTPLFAASPVAQMVVGGIGAFTALLAALIALTQNDLKRVLAYSTISQLGYMFLALGAGSVLAAIFHLFTHAFFKALLFLAAGSVMHAMGNVIDMRRFGGLRRILPTTHWTFLCGAAALAGLPPLSGFWSKDEILAGALFEAPHHHGYYQALFWVGLVTAGLTAFYTFRAYFLTFWGDERIPQEAGHHAHESPPVMTLPLMVLALGAVFAGIAVESPFSHLFSHLLAYTASLGIPTEHKTHVGLLLLSTTVAVGGVVVAWWMYLAQPGLAGRIAAQAQGLYQLSLNKFHFDELYDFFLVRPLTGIAEFSRVLDLHVLDGFVDLVGQVPRGIGLLFRPVQNGLVQFYALFMTVGLTTFLAVMLWLLVR